MESMFCKALCIQEVFFKIKVVLLKKAKPYSLFLECEEKKIQKLNADYEIQKKELQPEVCLPQRGSALLQRSWEQFNYVYRQSDSTW